MEKLTSFSKKNDNLSKAWGEASNYPKDTDTDVDVDWTPANYYVSMLERKVIEQNKTIEILQGKVEALDEMRKAWANGEIEN